MHEVREPVEELEVRRPPTRKPRKAQGRIGRPRRVDPLPVDLLRRFRRITVVGMSATVGKDSHDIPAYLAANGYDVVPVNPSGATILGAAAARSLADAPAPLGLVAIFRPSAEAAQHAKAALALGAEAIWLPLEVQSDEARAAAAEAGVPFVENTCLRTTHRLYVAK